MYVYIDFSLYKNSFRPQVFKNGVPLTRNMSKDIESSTEVSRDNTGSFKIRGAQRAFSQVCILSSPFNLLYFIH